jgi:hypothetical protein
MNEQWLKTIEDYKNKQFGINCATRDEAITILTLLGYDIKKFAYLPTPDLKDKYIISCIRQNLITEDCCKQYNYKIVNAVEVINGLNRKTIAQQLNITEFPFIIKDKNGNQIYYEDSKGYWDKSQYDQKGERIYYEDSKGFWDKSQYDQKGNEIYYEDSKGFWVKREYDQKGNEIYYEESTGHIRDKRLKVVELTLDEIAAKLNIDVNLLKIKK